MRAIHVVPAGSQALEGKPVQFINGIQIGVGTGKRTRFVQVRFDHVSGNIRSLGLLFQSLDDYVPESVIIEFRAEQSDFSFYEKTGFSVSIPIGLVSEFNLAS